MKSIFYMGIMAILWIINLFNGTGLGNAYHTTEYAKIVVCILTLVAMLLQFGQRKKMPIEKHIFYTYSLLVVFFVLNSFITGHGIQSLEYLWVYLIVYLLGKLSIDEKSMWLISVSYCMLGLIILYIYNYSNILNGWNANAIGMIGLHSFLVFIISYFKRDDLKNKMLLVLVGGIYIYLITPTDSRSSILFVVLGLLFALSFLSDKLIIGNKGRTIIWLFIPLVVASFVVFVSPTGIHEKLNFWSLREFKKPIFNGRDKIWIEGFRLLSTNLFIGTGKIQEGYWHNSAIACLTAVGLVGFYLWIRSIYSIVRKEPKWYEDNIVVGIVVSFFLLYVQQSVELGIFSPNPNLLPYVMLGLLLGRIRCLKRGECYGEN